MAKQVQRITERPSCNAKLISSVHEPAVVYFDVPATDDLDLGIKMSSGLDNVCKMHLLNYYHNYPVNDIKPGKMHSP